MTLADPAPSPSTRSLAGAALRAGQAAIGRSFRLHRPRGAFCHAGWCQQCLVTLPDGRRALACRVPAAAGNPEALGGRDPLRLVGRLAESRPPWFHERALLRPRAFRPLYLGLLRRLSAARPLGAPAPTGRGRWREARCRTFVVGAGLAGLVAAQRLAAAGRDLLMVDEGESPGGSARFMPAARAAAEEALAALRRTRVRLEAATLCVGLHDGGRRALCIGPQGPLAVAFEELVVATGSYDRLLPFAGNDLPGIVGVRAFERLCDAGSLPRGHRIGVFAEPALARRAVEAARAAALPLAWVGGPAPLGPEAAEVARLPPGRIGRACGRARLRAVALEPGGRRACELLVLGFAQPTYELQMQAGQTPILAGEPARLVPTGEAAVPLLVVGEAAGALSPLDAAEQAARAAEAWLAGAPAPPPAIPGDAAEEAPAPAVREDPAAFVCLCEDVRLRDVTQAIAEGFDGIELLKRRTGAGTGPCQGKLCHPELARCLRQAGRPVALPTVRPPIRPVPLSQLAGGDDG